MWKLRKSGLSVVLCPALLIWGFLAIDPDMGIAREEVKIESGIVNGDPGDALGNGGSVGDPVVGFVESATRVFGDPTDGTDLWGDPGDSLEFIYLEKKSLKYLGGLKIILGWEWIWSPIVPQNY